MGAILQKSAVYDYCKRWTRATHATILTVRSPGTGTIPGYLEDDMKIWKPTSVWSTLTNLTHLRLDCIHDDWSRSNIALLLPTPLFFEASNLTHLTLCAIDWDDVSAWASFWGSVPASLRELYFVDFDFDVGLYKLLRADLLGGMDLKSLSKVVWIVEDAQTAFRDWKAFELDFLEDSTKNGPEDHRITMALQDAEEAELRRTSLSAEELCQHPQYRAVLDRLVNDEWRDLLSVLRQIRRLLRAKGISGGGRDSLFHADWDRWVSGELDPKQSKTYLVRSPTLLSHAQLLSPLGFSSASRQLNEPECCPCFALISDAPFGQATSRMSKNAQLYWRRAHVWVGLPSAIYAIRTA